MADAAPEHRGRGWNLRGGRPEGAGRKKGTPNKVTREFRDIVQNLIDKNAENVERWLEITANGLPAEYAEPDENGERRLIRAAIPGDPAKALDLVNKLAEYAAPKLSRSEITGPGGQPLAPPVMRLEIASKPEEPGGVAEPAKS